jgi:DNA-binding PadR family transcriptional regulator
MSAGEAVLGLLIDRPGRACELERRLKERFGAARYSYSTAYSALRRLKADGYVRAMEPASQSSQPTTEQESEEGVVYEATQDGIEYFHAWMVAPTSAPIPREELHVRLALCQPRDLPRLIEVVHLQELACTDELDRVRKRMIAQQDSTGTRTVAQEDWRTLMDEGVAHGEAALWGGRIAQLGHLRTYLEQLRDEAERRALHQHRLAMEPDRRTA